MAYTDISGRKLQSRMGAALNESAASHSPALLSSRQSFAKRQLEKMGWTEGTGLGKNRDGTKEHVKVKQRADEMGLGREKELAKEVGNVWWKDSLGGTLARLQQKKQKKKGDRKDRKKDGRKSKKRKDDSGEYAAAAKIYTDEELFAATGGARFGMRAQRRAEGKWKRTEAGEELKALEEKAKASMEWNGRGNAQALIEGATKKKRKRVKEDVNTVSPSISEEEQDTDEDGKESKSKRRKVENSKLHQVSLSVSEEEEKDASNDEESKKKKKKRKKKEKKSKKSCKK